MNRQEIQSEYESIKSDLNKLFKNFELIPGSPKDEFDALSRQLLNHLYKGLNENKVHRIISSELITRYGLSINGEDVQEITEEVILIWNSRIS